MPLQFVCPRGHRWESVTEGGSVCPECGAASSVDTAVGDGGTARGDKLPPPPGGDTVPTLLPPPAGQRPSAWPAVPGFEIRGVAGKGGMGLVYRAWQLSLKRDVALKCVLTDAEAGDPETMRFRLEAESVARLNHPNVVHVYDIVEADGRLYCALEYVPGGSLKDRLAAGRQPLREAVALVEVLARAMHYVHQRHIVHRDLKPGNVLLDADGALKITDFGLAKRLDQVSQHTPDGAMLGTPGYMAPEQARGDVKAIGPATDVYALGVILYELLTGQCPFQGTLFEVLQRINSEAPLPPSRLNAAVPAELETICLRCLEKEPARRYPSAADLAEALRQFLLRLPADAPTAAAIPVTTPASPSVTAPVPPPPPAGAAPPPQGGKPGGKRLVLVALALALVVAAAVPLGKWVLGLLRNGSTSNRTEASSEGAWQMLAIGGPEGEVFDRLAFPGCTVGYAAGRHAVYKTENSGKTWHRVADRAAPGRTHVFHFQDDRTGWLGAERLYGTADGGVSWSEVPLPEPTRVVSGLATGDGWALAGGTTSGGELVLFRRLGAGPWEKLDPGKAGHRGGDTGPYRRWFVGDLKITGPQVALLILQAGYEDRGALLRTEDRGGTWTVVLTPDHELHRVAFADEQRCWMTGGHSLWRTTDGGRTWAPQPVPADAPLGSLAFARGREVFGLAPLWRGQVLQSTDGEHWQTVPVGLEYSLPDVAVVDRGCAYVLESDGHVARYLAPAK
jgi:photosystem II stability/assembly factor-like uncharacterized protein